MVDRLRFSTVRGPRRRQTLPGLDVVSGQMLINVVAGIYGVVLAAYLWSGSPLLFLALVVVVAGGADQALRAHPAGQFSGVAATAMYLFVPLLYAAGAALFVSDVSEGVWNVPAAAIAALFLALAIKAEYLTVEVKPETYPNARFLLSLVSYLTAFAFFVIVSTSDLRLPAATLVVALVTFLLSVDALRELEVQNTILFAYAAAIAVVVAEVRWAMYYLGLPDLLGGGFLLVAYYELTGLVQSYLSGHLDRGTVKEFSGIGAIGFAVIAAFAVWSRRS